VIYVSRVKELETLTDGKNKRYLVLFLPSSICFVAFQTFLIKV